VGQSATGLIVDLSAPRRAAVILAPRMDPFGITSSPLDVAALVALVSSPDAGAVATFVGTSRRTSSNAANVEKPVETLWYEAYEPMAVKGLRAIGDDAARRFEVTRVAAWHRVGEVAIGEASVAIAVSAPHRAAAFDACRFVIEEIKRSLPVWKRERFRDGEEWVEGHTPTT
jgi:molybdopterin synthase catalytic subunit